MIKNEALREQDLSSSKQQRAFLKRDKEIQSKTEFVGSICPNCGTRLEGRKCKLFCPTRGCGYLVTCSEW
jgi:uncharacterized protein with PIN domain